MDRQPAAGAAALTFSSSSAKPCPVPCFSAVPLTPSGLAAAIVPFASEPFCGRSFRRSCIISRSSCESSDSRIGNTVPRAHGLIVFNAAAPVRALEPENGLTAEGDEDCGTLPSSSSASRCSLESVGAPAAGADSEGLLDIYDSSGGKVELVKQWWPWLPVWAALPIKEEFVVVPVQSNGESFLWEGWGTSLCWWANFAGGLDADNREHILDLLFDSSKGLGFNIVRYNIGGGANPEINEYLRLFGHIPGFKSAADCPYDWSSDERQRIILLGARDRGADVFEAFSNSPPYWMTLSGSVTGNTRWGQDNLNQVFDEAFVDYLTEVVNHFEKEWGIQFDYIAPFNEPVEGWWNINRRKKTAQEGCNFSLASINRLIPKLKHALDMKKMRTKISAFDAWSQNTVKVLKGMDDATLSAIDQINVHTYVFVTSREDYAKRKKVREAAAKLGKKVWMSEYGPLNWGGSEIDVALGLGKHITLDMNELQASAWCYWQAVEPPGSLWGLLQTPFIYSDDDAHPINLHITKQYYVLMQFSRWIKPGFKIYLNDVISDCLLASTDPLGNTVVLVITNDSDVNRDYSYDASAIAPGLEGRPIQGSLFRTSATEDHVELAKLAFEQPTAIVRAVRKSVTTVILSADTCSHPEAAAV